MTHTLSLSPTHLCDSPTHCNTLPSSGTPKRLTYSSPNFCWCTSSLSLSPVIPPTSLSPPPTGIFARMGKFACYVVIRGRRPGIYSTWDECKAQVEFYRDALYWGCHSEEEAVEALTRNCRVESPTMRSTDSIIEMLKRPKIVDDSPCSSTSLPSPGVEENSPSPSVVAIGDEWKFVKHLVAILLISLTTLVVLVIAIVVKLYLL